MTLWKRTKQKIRDDIKGFRERMELQEAFYNRKSKPEPLTEKEKEILSQMLKKED